MERRLRDVVVVLAVQVDRHLEERHAEAGEQRRLRRDRAEVRIEEVELLLAQLDRLLLDGRAQQQLVGREHRGGDDSDAILPSQSSNRVIRDTLLELVSTA